MTKTNDVEREAARIQARLAGLPDTETNRRAMSTAAAGLLALTATLTAGGTR